MSLNVGFVGLPVAVGGLPLSWSGPRDRGAGTRGNPALSRERGSFRGVAPPAGKSGSTPVPSACTIWLLRGRDAGARFPNRRDSIGSQEGGSMAARRQIRTFKPAACTKGIHHLYVGLKGSKLACLSRRLASG